MRGWTPVFTRGRAHVARGARGLGTGAGGEQHAQSPARADEARAHGGPAEAQARGDLSIRELVSFPQQVHGAKRLVEPGHGCIDLRGRDVGPRRRRRLRLRLSNIRQGGDALLGRRTATPAASIDEQVIHDSQQPAAIIGVAGIDGQGGHLFQTPLQGILDQVLRIVLIAGELPREAQERRSMRAGDVRERGPGRDSGPGRVRAAGHRPGCRCHRNYSPLPASKQGCITRSLRQRTTCAIFPNGGRIRQDSRQTSRRTAGRNAGTPRTAHAGCPSNEPKRGPSCPRPQYPR